MSHPFERLPTGTGRRVFLPLLALTLLLTAVLAAAGGPLRDEGVARYGILSFEFAGGPTRARAIVATWTRAGALPYAAFNLGLDFLYLAVYSTTGGFACAWAAVAIRAYSRTLASAGLVLAWGQWAAALLDAAENVALLRLLFGPVVAPWPQIAAWCAALKFGLIGAGLLCAAAGAGAWFAARGRNADLV